jgi:polyhydroxyalkanoate synthesis regulator phasin
MEVKFKVRDLYEVQVLFKGAAGTHPITKAPFEILGFLSSPLITEGMRRIANKAAKRVDAELAVILEQRQKLAQAVVEGEFETEEAKAAAQEALLKENRVKDETLLNDECILSIEEQIDFKRIEDLKFPHDYTLIFEKFCVNYN